MTPSFQPVRLKFYDHGKAVYFLVKQLLYCEKSLLKSFEMMVKHCFAKYNRDVMIYSILI